MNIRDRKKREEYMDALERQMADRREQMQLTLDRIEILGRQRKALNSLRTFLPSFASRTPTEDTRELETTTERQAWWRRMFGG
jgi:hypothetical protein